MRPRRAITPEEVADYRDTKWHMYAAETTSEVEYAGFNYRVSVRKGYEEERTILYEGDSLIHAIDAYNLGD